METSESSRKITTLASSNASVDSSLFRPEALNERYGQIHGPLRLAQPISNWIITFATTVFISLMLVLIFCGQLPKKVSVIGITQPVSGSLSVIAPTSGTLAKKLIDEGDFVRQGQPLFQISTERQSSVGEVAKLLSQQLEARKFSLDNEERNKNLQASEKRLALNERIRNIKIQHTQLEMEIELASRRKLLAEQTVDKFRELQQLKFASAMQVQEKQEALIDLEGRLGTLKRTQSQLQENLIGLEAESKNIDLSLAADIIQLKRAKASLEQEIIENENRRGVFIVSPTSGQITAVPYKVGQGILIGQVLATIVAGSQRGTNTNELEVHLYAPSRTTGFIEKGQIVNLRYQAFPYQKFGLQRGVITSIGTTPFAPNEIPTNIATTILSNAQQSTLGLTNNEALYRIIVKPESQYINAYGTKHLLKPGMSLDADIVQEKSYIWEWLLEPARALRGF